jgi:hypothetical protein
MSVRVIVTKWRREPSVWTLTNIVTCNRSYQWSSASECLYIVELLRLLVYNINKKRWADKETYRGSRWNTVMKEN